MLCIIFNYGKKYYKSCVIRCLNRGGAERFIAPVLKTGDVKASAGSNPVSSAIGLMVEWLQFHPVTVRGTGSNPVETAIMES